MGYYLSRVKQFKKTAWTFKNGTDKLSRNVGTEVPLYDA